MHTQSANPVRSCTMTAQHGPWPTQNQRGPNSIRYGGSSASDIFVGSDEGILHWDGSEWTAMTLPEETRVLSLWGFSASEVYATDSSTKLLRYDGSSWSVFEDFYGATIPRAVWGSSTSDIFVGGYSPFEDHHAYHYDGSSWTAEDGVNSGIETIWGSASNDVYAAGTSGFMVHYDGSTWSNISRHYVEYRFMNGLSASDIYAVGHYGLIDYFDGSSWNIQNGTNIWSLNDVMGFSESNIYAVGDSGTVLQYDGTTWNRLDPLAQARDNEGIYGITPSNIYVVNCLDNGLSFDGGDIFQYDGTNWSAVVEDALVCMRDIWAFDANNVFAVGNNEDRDGWIYRYDGSSWQNEELQPVRRASSVSGSSATNVIATGSNGTAAIFDGTSWSTMNTGTSTDINSVIVFSETEAYAVDDNGLLLSYDGQRKPRMDDGGKGGNETDHKNLGYIWGRSLYDRQLLRLR